MTRLLRGRAIALFAFDIGFEVALGQLGRLPSSARVQPLSPKKQTPSFLQYAEPPLVVHQLLTDRVRTVQSQTLELIIIILILAEILMAIFSR